MGLCSSSVSNHRDAGMNGYVGAEKAPLAIAKETTRSDEPIHSNRRPATVAMSACENLPQELIMAIVDNIRDDKKSLEAFSLVCKAWTDPARDHLFALLYIDDLKDLEKIKAANIASTYTPFLRYLRLSATGNHPTFWQEVISFLADIETPRLQSLALSDFAWQTLSPNERSAFICRFNSIVCLWLRIYTHNTSNDIATIICSFPHLQRLLLLPNVNTHALSGPSPLSSQLRLPERLSTLRVGYFFQNYQSVLAWLGSTQGQLSIHTLQLYMRWLLPQDLDVINNLLKALGPSLEVFWCDSDQQLSIDLTYNTQLRCINFRLKELEIFSRDVSFAMSTLSRIGSRQVAQVAFRFSDHSRKDRESRNTEWIKLDALLAGPQFAALNDVRIYAPSDLSKLFATFLPMCHARGIISLVEPSSV